MDASANLTEGERWTRDLLDHLRVERFTPAAWQRFLSDSARRSRAIRARRPALVRQSRRWGAAGLAAAAPFGPRAAAWWALSWAMLDWHLGMAETADGRERPLAAHDALTLARLWAVPVVRRHPEPRLVAAALASDLADGALARRAGPTRLGRDLDAAADTLLLGAILRALVDRGALDRRVLALEQARLALGIAVALRSYFGASRPLPVRRERRAPAVVAAAGALLAATGRTRAAEPLLAAASAKRALLHLRGGPGAQP